ncbi:hypothetical protein BD769DRAFT_1661701 [Suillus cothurnatus]|nr:hypothetical protein BD769DRAFT_1661701 [Suillus cothurnatus]
MSSPLTQLTWTPAQAAALHGIRTAMSAFKPTFGQAQSLAECTQVPSEGIPEGIHITCELASPSSQIPASIHSTSIKPGQVPVFFYTDAPSESFADVKKDVKVILHVHGGGNVSGHPTEQRFISLFSHCHIPYIRASHPKFWMSDPIRSDPQIHTGSVTISFFIHILFI